VSPASFTLTGNNVDITAGRVLNVSPASFTLTGNNVELRVGRQINVTAASYVLTGYSVELSYSGASVTLFSYADLEIALKTLISGNGVAVSNIFVEGMEREVLNLSHMPLINIRIIETNPEIISLDKKYIETITLAIDIVAFDFTSYAAASRIRSALIEAVRGVIAANKLFYSFLDSTTMGPSITFAASGENDGNGHIAMATMTVTCQVYVN
jgi:hypothetical protein